MANIILTTFYLLTCRLFSYSRMSRVLFRARLRAALQVVHVLSARCSCVMCSWSRVDSCAFALVVRAVFVCPSVCYVARVRVSFARCRAVSRVINLSRLESPILIKLLN
jgi:hypothetical protein